MRVLPLEQFHLGMNREHLFDEGSSNRATRKHDDERTCFLLAAHAVDDEAETEFRAYSGQWAKTTDRPICKYCTVHL
jgi:hypothetical protein